MFKHWRVWFGFDSPALAFILSWSKPCKSLYIMVDLIVVGFSVDIYFTKERPRLYEISKIKGETK